MMKIYLSYIVFNCAIPGFRCMIPSICHPKTLDGILPPLMQPPFELNYLSLRCHFDGYKDNTPDSNSHWSCSKMCMDQFGGLWVIDFAFVTILCHLFTVPHSGIFYWMVLTKFHPTYHATTIRQPIDSSMMIKTCEMLGYGHVIRVGLIRSKT